MLLKFLDIIIRDHIDDLDELPTHVHEIRKLTPKAINVVDSSSVVSPIDSCCCDSIVSDSSSCDTLSSNLGIIRDSISNSSGNPPLLISILVAVAALVFCVYMVKRYQRSNAQIQKLQP